ncbi:MAG: hypothetical protein DI605_00185 [Sphingomonas sp.]|nr:MAG: hypothetical protein DI605_00185 [Sphingomonas sp.]
MVGGLVAAPPANGRMMLVPLSESAAQGMAAAAIDKGASLIGQGPLPGSIVVDGNRDALFRTLLNRGVALLAAPVTGCGQ